MEFDASNLVSEINRINFMSKAGRCLEIGAGSLHVKGFEQFNLGPEKKSDGHNVKTQHSGDCRQMHMFSENTFGCIYSSHCIEHVHWYQLQSTINEWTRILKPNGTLEVWTVDGYKVMKQLIMLEETGKTTVDMDLNWRKNLTGKDPYNYLVGKLYNYTHNGAEFDYHMHRALITPKHLVKVFENAGLKNVHVAEEKENRIPNRHGWINMGVIGVK